MVIPRSVGIAYGVAYAVVLFVAAALSAGFGHGDMYPIYAAASPWTLVVVVADLAGVSIGASLVVAPAFVWGVVGYLVVTRRYLTLLILLLAQYAVSTAMWRGMLGTAWSDEAY